MLSCYVTLPCIFYVICSHFTYSSCNNLISVISRVLIYSYLNFCSLTSPTSCNSPRKCTPVKGKVKQKAGYQCFIQTTSYTKFRGGLRGGAGGAPLPFFLKSLFSCDQSEELHVFIEVKLIINNALLTYFRVLNNRRGWTL